MPASLTRVVRFRAEHHLGRPDHSPAENRARFGPLADPHAHDYTCLVTVGGPMDTGSGMIMDLGVLDRILDEEVRRLDGRDLNRDFPELIERGGQPTCEALATWLFERIARRLPMGKRLERVRIEEDPTLYAEYSDRD